MMTLAYWMILVAGLLPYVTTPLARGKAFDNSRPRDGYALADGLQKRAYGAHLNSFEVFPLFAVAVLVAMMAGANVSWLNALAAIWVVSRVVYILAYLKDMATLRSAVFAAGMLVVLGIFTLPWWGPYPEGF